MLELERENPSINNLNFNSWENHEENMSNSQSENDEKEFFRDLNTPESKILEKMLEFEFKEQENSSISSMNSD